MNKWQISDPVYESDIINETLKVSPWAGHRNFAYDLIKFINPQVVTELGTHFGCSFFAFCQAIKDCKLNTKIFAVDTWQGDEQAGYYSEEVYDVVTNTIETYFNMVSLELKKMYFTEALRDFKEESIDILHIDGLHTYESVKEDFTTWLPKLKKNGAILFHDIAEYTGYGSHQFWEEIKTQYRHFEFSHSWGLGILFPKGDLIYQKLIKENMLDKIQIYYFKAESTLANYKVQDLEKMSLERFYAIEEQTKMIDERNHAIDSMKKMIDERYTTMIRMDKLIKEKDNALKEQTYMLDDRYKSISKMDTLIKERDNIIRNQNLMLEERYQAILKMEKMVNERDEIINEQKHLIDERHKSMLAMEQIIKERDFTIVDQNKMLIERYEAIQEMDQMIKERDFTIVDQNKMLSKDTKRYKKWRND